MADPITPRIWQQPTTTPTAAPTTLSFGNGETFDTQGNAVNQQAKTGLSTLGVSGNQYTGYVSPVVRSSTPFEQQVNNLGNTINTSANTPPVTPLPSNPTGTYNPLYDPNQDPKVANEIASSNQVLSDRQKELQAERDALIKSLTEQGAVDKQQLEDTQKRETGTTNRNLLYLQQGGQSASAQAYLNTLEVSHQRELSNLTAKYNSAIQQAKNAYSEKDFALAQAMVKNASDIKRAAEERNQQFLDNTIKIHNEMQQDQQLQYQRQQDLQKVTQDARDYATKNGITESFYEVGGETFRSRDGKWYDPNNPQEFIKDGGKPDYSNVFVVKPNENKQYAGGDLGEFQYLVDVGTYKPGQFMDFLHAKANQRERVARAGASITYNQSVDQAQTQAAALIGSAFSKLSGKDGYVSPEDYKQGLAKWTAAGYSAVDFNNQFLNFMNPTDAQRGNYGITK